MATTTYGTEYVQSSDLVSNWPGSSLNVANRIDNVSLVGNGINNQTGTSYTLALADGGKLVTFSNAAAIALTVPTDASVAFPTGVRIKLTNKGAGNVTVAGAGGVTVNGNTLTIAQNRSAMLYKLDTNTWVMTADPTIPADPGLIYVTGSSFTSVSAVNVNNCFSATYSQYRVIAAFTNTGGAITLRMRSGGTDNTASTYSGNAPYVANWNGAFGAHSTVNQTSVTLDGSGSARFVFDYVFYEPFVAIATAITGTQVEDRGGFGFAAYHNTASSFDGFSVLGTGMTGNIRIYGFRNS